MIETITMASTENLHAIATITITKIENRRANRIEIDLEDVTTIKDATTIEDAIVVANRTNTILDLIDLKVDIVIVDEMVITVWLRVAPSIFIVIVVTGIVDRVRMDSFLKNY
jgi:hypothetical protein